jgi:hypothetical protein
MCPPYITVRRTQQKHNLFLTVATLCIATRSKSLHSNGFSSVLADLAFPYHSEHERTMETPFKLLAYKFRG